MEDLVALYTIWIFGGTGVKLAFTLNLWSTKREKNNNAISRLKLGQLTTCMIKGVIKYIGYAFAKFLLPEYVTISILSFYRS